MRDVPECRVDKMSCNFIGEREMDPKFATVMWVRWVVWSLIGLALFIGVIGIGGYCAAFLLGWAFGVVVWACLILMRQPDMPDRRPVNVSRQART